MKSCLIFIRQLFLLENWYYFIYHPELLLKPDDRKSLYLLMLILNI